MDISILTDDGRDIPAISGVTSKMVALSIVLNDPTPITPPSKRLFSSLNMNSTISTCIDPTRFQLINDDGSVISISPDRNPDAEYHQFVKREQL